MEDEETQEQPEKQPADHLKPWQFKPGQSGNPGGRPLGSKSLKTFAREYLESLSDEDKLEFMKGMDKIDIFKMAEGNPDNKTDLTTKGEPISSDIDLDTLAEKLGKEILEKKINAKPTD